MRKRAPGDKGVAQGDTSKEAPAVSDQSRDRVEGTFDDLKGRGKAAWGELTDDEELKTEGHADRAKGAAKKGFADAKEAVDAAVKKVTGD
jgi:uncharacterized protein YjbJ (UPF0337 family)